MENDQVVANIYNNNLNIKNNNYNNSYNLNIDLNVIQDNLSHQDVEDSDKILISKRRTSTIKLASPKANITEQRKVSPIKKLVQNLFRKRKATKNSTENKNIQDMDLIDNDHVLNDRNDKFTKNLQSKSTSCGLQSPILESFHLLEYCRAYNIRTDTMLMKILEAICDSTNYKG